jgi:hypothetical protein
VLGCLVWYPGQNKRKAALPFFNGYRKRLTVLISETDCNQTAMGSPPLMPAVLLIA